MERQLFGAIPWNVTLTEKNIQKAHNKLFHAVGIPDR